MEPVSTCKLFGAVRAVSGIRNAVPLIHGPRGCAYHTGYLLTARGGKRIRVLSTELSESDVVFGATDKLKKAIVDADRTLKPDLIAVMSSCATSIIGEDLGRAVAEVRGKIDSQIIAISAGGFESNQGEGYLDVMMALIESLSADVKPSAEPSINIIGEFRGGPDLNHIVNTLGGMGVSVNCVLTSGSTVSDIERIASAHLNYSFCDVSGIDPCRFLEEKFGIPFIHHPIPLGFSNTLRFYEGILDHLSIDYPIQDEIGEYAEEMDRLRSELGGVRVGIVSGPTRAVALAEFVTELGMKPALVAMDMIGDYTLENLSGTGVRSEVLVGADLYELEDALIRNEPEVILGGVAETRFSQSLGVPLIDVMHGSALTAGFRGACVTGGSILEAVRSRICY
ncbi:nitrogenase component 1 [Methanothermobacter sp. K4]|uniref:nitrogenase component 1 n=1 Tax=Methanothermobacter sp. K4 TaxID=2913262 RepID=UPI001EDB189E|nr:nitrogenase component 1 [Methanothermobacter sp. K4]MCG2827887.1 nitrogenase component 1 [Methanothermobacter sp. K4]